VPAPANADAMVLDLTNEDASNSATATTPGGPGGFRNDFESYSPFGNES
jgi:hypothetical protein